MALEQAGISLEAQGFSDYIKKLDAIDKRQRAVFETQFKDTGKSYDQVTAAAKKYEAELKRLTTTEEKAAKQAEALAAAQQRQAGKAQVGSGVKSVFSGDVTGGVRDIAGGIKAIGPTAAVATAGIAALTVGAVAAGAAIVAIGAGAVSLANQTDQATKQISASLGITAVQAADRYGEALRNIYADNPKAQFEQIAEAIALTERALDLDTAGIEQVASDALKISQVFGKDVQKTIGATEQLVEQFGLTGQQATDLLTFGLQNIPAEDLIDSISEYSNQFAQAGFSADEFFSILSTGAAGGVLGTDKAGDAVKEFQIRFLEGNKTLKDSFATLGLSFDDLTTQVSSGQLNVADVFGQVIDRIKEVDLSVASNRAAVAGLGTQFEDLGAAAFAALDLDAIGFADVAGSADKLDEQFNNLGDAFTSIKRSFLLAFEPIGKLLLDLASSAVPLIKSAFESIRPGLESFSQGTVGLVNTLQERFGPAVESVRESIGQIFTSLSAVSKAFDTGGASVDVFGAILSGVVAVIDLVANGISEIADVVQFLQPYLTSAGQTFQQVFALAKAGAAAFGSIFGDVVTTAIASLGTLGKAFLKFIELDFKGALSELGDIEIFDIGASLDKAGQAATDSLRNSLAAGEPVEIPIEVDTTALPSPPEMTAPFDAQSGAIGDSIGSLEAYKGALAQAADLQRSFAQQAEDDALKLARANEDIARNQARDVAKLQESQARDRDKLLKDQAKQLDDFEADRRKQITDAENEIREAKRQAAEQQKRDQDKLNRELAQAQERFNLSQLQSRRRFDLQESRLRAEGDILGLKELREDFALSQQEEKENFDLSKKEQIDNAQETQKEQTKDLENKLSELKSNLETQRAELLASFDEQLIAQQQAQAEAQAEQQRGFEEAAAERAIQLAREEEDRRISQAQQLEDLGRSLSEQKGVTAEGAAGIAGELEKVFGIEGVADSIMTGFEDKTEADFKNLFKNLQEQFNTLVLKTPKVETPSLPSSATPGPGVGTQPGRLGGEQEFAEGGIVQGPLGSPQRIIAHAGETVLPTHKSSFQMAAPIIPSQNLNVKMAGGFNVSGDGAANDQILQAAMTEMTDSFRIAIQRLARRN